MRTRTYSSATLFGIVVTTLFSGCLDEEVSIQEDEAYLEEASDDTLAEGGESTDSAEADEESSDNEVLATITWEDGNVVTFTYSDDYEEYYVTESGSLAKSQPRLEALQLDDPTPLEAFVALTSDGAPVPSLLVEQAKVALDPNVVDALVETREVLDEQLDLEESTFVTGALPPLSYCGGVGTQEDGASCADFYRTISSGWSCRTKYDSGSQKVQKAKGRLCNYSNPSQVGSSKIRVSLCHKNSSGANFSCSHEVWAAAGQYKYTSVTSVYYRHRKVKYGSMSGAERAQVNGFFANPASFWSPTSCYSSSGC